MKTQTKVDQCSKKESQNAKKGVFIDNTKMHRAYVDFIHKKDTDFIFMCDVKKCKSKINFDIPYMQVEYDGKLKYKHWAPSIAEFIKWDITTSRI